MLHVYVPVLMRSAKDFTVKFAGAGAGDEVFLNPVRFKVQPIASTAPMEGGHGGH